MSSCWDLLELEKIIWCGSGGAWSEQPLWGEIHEVCWQSCRGSQAAASSALIPEFLILVHEIWMLPCWNSGGGCTRTLPLSSELLQFFCSGKMRAGFRPCSSIPDEVWQGWSRHCPWFFISRLKKNPFLWSQPCCLPPSLFFSLSNPSNVVFPAESFMMSIPRNFEFVES